MKRIQNFLPDGTLRKELFSGLDSLGDFDLSMGFLKERIPGGQTWRTHMLSSIRIATYTIFAAERLSLGDHVAFSLDPVAFLTDQGKF